MIIEFIGTPGAGKSTFASITQNILDEFGVKAMSVYEAGPQCLRRTYLGQTICFITPDKWQKRVLHTVFRRLVFWYRLIFVVKYRQLSWQVLSLTVRHRASWNHKRMIIRWFFRDASYYQFFHGRLRPSEILILDEGIIHRATSLYSSPSNTPDVLKIKWYITHIPQADLIIWVHTPLDVCIDRVDSRGIDMRYKGEDLRLFIANSAKTIEVAMETVNSLSRNVIELSNNSKLDAGIVDLRSQLSRNIMVNGQYVS